MHSTNPLSISAAPTTGMIQKPYYDLPSTVTVMNRLLHESAVDGFEVQNLAEWNKENPPKDDVSGNRYTAWKRSPKYTVEEAAALLEGLPILSIHANRDVGIYLCSNREQDITKGKRLIHESLSLAEKVGAGVCVFHLWDTWKSQFDVGFLQEILHTIAPQYPVTASVENVPTHLEGVTPFDLVKEFEWVTLDLRWAAMYDELDRFESVTKKITNIHLRGQLQGDTWMLTGAPFGFYEALDIIQPWQYSGLLTVEPEGGLHSSNWENLVAALVSIRSEL